MYHVQMKKLITLLLACCFGSAMAQSNWPTCPSSVDLLWTNCYGTYTYPNGDKYVGEYKDGEQHGQGTYTFPNRDKYVGEFKDAQRNGQGTYTYADGSKYVGEYKDDKFNGEGAYTFANGNKYVGEFKDHNFNGQGIKYLANGKVDKSGIWKDDKLVQSKFIDVATFTRIPNLSNSASNLAQLRKTEEQPMAQSNLPACQGKRSTWTNCVGAYTYSSGAKYVGEFKDGKFNGEGAYTFANGGKYVGEFKDGKYNGQGIWFRANGNVRKSGIWNDGLLVQSKFIDVATFTRMLNLSISAYNLAQLRKTEEQPMAQRNLPACQGKRSTWTNCVGAYTFGSGNKYVGEYKDGKYNGQGTYTWPNGNKYVGEFKDDNFNGQGTYTFPNGNKYVGEFKDDNFNGQGTYTYANGNKYVGEIKDDNPNMQLTISYANGNKSVGEFKDDKFNGQGTYTYASGGKYVGEFKDGKWNGQGIWFRANGNVRKSGIWKDDNLVQSKFIDVATFTRIPNLSNSASNLAQLRKTEEQAKQKQAELEAQRKATELALAQATKAAQEQVKLEAQLAAQQQIQIKPAAQIAPQGKRVALVIGNAKYKFSPLNNPVNDATDMAASLRSVGFDVIEVKDATLKQMRAATRQFADKLEVSDVGLVYYSGHGIEVKGKNYLIPVNADIRREYEVVDQAFDASNLLRMMESLQSGTKKRVNILIVDACRNNDLPKSWRSTNNGLARMDAPAGSFISFATAPGQVAADGQGRNSPYTKHLLQALKQPNVPIEQVFKQVRRKVMAETAGEQVPWENSSLVGDFYFTVAR